MNTLSQNGSIQKTKDYSIFKFRDDNREVCPNHVSKLVFSMKRQNDLHLHPIIVNSDYEIIDGQHRFKAAKELELPIHYVMDDDFDPRKLIIFNTTQRKWLPMDYLRYWCSHGKDDYIKLKNFMDDVKIPLATLMIWLSTDSNNRGVDFKNGTFKFMITEKVLSSLFDTIKLIDHLKDINFKPTTMFNQREFHRGCKNFFTNPLVDGEVFFDRIHHVPFKIRYSTHKDDYTEQLVEIYNFKARTSRLNLIRDNKGISIEKAV